MFLPGTGFVHGVHRFFRASAGASRGSRVLARLRLLDDALVSRILDEARPPRDDRRRGPQRRRGRAPARARGARGTSGAGSASPPVVDRALAPRRARCASSTRSAAQTHELGGDACLLHAGLGGHPRPRRRDRPHPPASTADYVRYAKLVAGLPHIAAQSTAFIPADVPEGIQDSYRLFLSLLLGEKPVVTGAFGAGGSR
jgi:hypothetical protein